MSVRADGFARGVGFVFVVDVVGRDGRFQRALQNREETVHQRDRLGRERVEALLAVRVHRLRRNARRRGVRRVAGFALLRFELLHDGVEQIGGGHPRHEGGAGDEAGGGEVGRRGGEDALRVSEERKEHVDELDAMHQRLVEREKHVIFRGDRGFQRRVGLLDRLDVAGVDTTAQLRALRLHLPLHRVEKVLPQIAAIDSFPQSYKHMYADWPVWLFETIRRLRAEPPTRFRFHGFPHSSLSSSLFEERVPRFDGFDGFPFFLSFGFGDLPEFGAFFEGLASRSSLGLPESRGSVMPSCLINVLASSSCVQSIFVSVTCSVSTFASPSFPLFSSLSFLPFSCSSPFPLSMSPFPCSFSSLFPCCSGSWIPAGFVTSWKATGFTENRRMGCFIGRQGCATPTSHLIACKASQSTYGQEISSTCWSLTRYHAPSIQNNAQSLTCLHVTRVMAAIRVIPVVMHHRHQHILRLSAPFILPVRLVPLFFLQGSRNSQSRSTAESARRSSVSSDSRSLCRTAAAACGSSAPAAAP